MDYNEALKCCRYYKGEKENPFKGVGQNKANLWFYEQIWVERGMHSADPDTLNVYEAYGLKSFSSDDGVPLSLKVLLFNRFLHWCGGYGMEEDVKNFKQFYLQQYLSQD